MAQAKHTGGQTVALNVAREGGGALEINVTGPQLDIHRVDATFRLRFGHGELITITGPKVYDTRDCSDIGQIFIENDEAAADAVVELFWSSVVKAGKADAAVETALNRRVVREITGSQGFAIFDTAGIDGASETSWGHTMDSVRDVVPNGMVGGSFQQGVISPNVAVPIWMMFNPVLDADLSSLEGYQCGFEFDAYVTRTEVGGNAVYDALIGFGGNVNYTAQNNRSIFGLACLKGSSEWKLACRLKPDGATLTAPTYAVISESTGITAIDELHRFQIIVGVDGGVPFLRAFADGEQVAEHVGRWPLAAFNAVPADGKVLANQFWTPIMVSALDITVGGGALRIYTLITGSIRVWVVDPAE